MNYYIYVLFSGKDRKLYIGYSTNLKQRIKQHICGEVKSTKNRRPLYLIYYEVFCLKSDAEAREKYLKSGYGHEQLKNILKNFFTSQKI
ncbi:MAG: GIY-YIG nuclease family protein [Candidatus Nealsonbacteria bacterium]